MAYFNRLAIAAMMCGASQVCIVPALAQAEPQGSQTQETGGDIVVTATRRDTTLQTTPINISAVTTDQIEKQRIDNVQALARYVPGLSMVDQGPRSQSQLIVRGISASSTSPVVLDNNAVATYMGEVPLFVDFKLIDIARVEVLRGPQGTLYGAGTLAGALRYLPNRPDPKAFSVDAHARVYDVAHGSGVGAIGDVAINIPILEDKVAFRTATGYYRDPGFIDSPYIVREPGTSLTQPNFTDPAAVDANLRYTKDVNDERTLTSRNSLLVTPVDGLEAIFTYAYQRTRTDGRQANSYGVLGLNRYQNGSRILEKMDRKAHLFSVEINAEVADFIKLTSSTSVTKQSFAYARDLTDEVLGYEYGYEDFPSFTAIGNQRNRINQINQELRVSSIDKGPLQWVIGGYLNQTKTNNGYLEYTPGYPDFIGVDRQDDLEFAARSSTKTIETAAFGEIQYKITPKWQAAAGARYYNYQAFGEGGQAVPFVDGSVYPAIEYSNRFGRTGADGFVYKFNTSYEFSDQLFAYATYSTGYRIGGINRVAPCPDPLPSAGQIACALPRELFYGPDKTKNKEIGLRANFFNRKLNLTLSAFEVNWNGVQINSTTTYGAIGITANAGKAVSRGVEATFVAKPTPELTFSGSYSYTDAHLTEDAPSIVRGIYPAFSGDRLPQSPKHAASIIANYVIKLNDENEVSLNWGATYTGSTLTTVGARGFGEKVPDYLLNQASITYRAKNWEIGLFADNIFDKCYHTGVFTFSDDNAPINGYIRREYGQIVGRPRTIGIDGRIRF